MDLETTQTTTTAKLPILKQENGNSFKPAGQTTTNANGTSPGLVTTEEKVQKNNDVEERSMLLMSLTNEHLMTFNQYKDAKTLFAAIQIRFGGNEATKKTQKTLLKEIYENFSAPNIESLDSIFNRLQKIVSQRAIFGENISQEDLNLKFFRSLPSEWNTHVVVWRNKPDLDTMSFHDLYNNFKIVEQEVKGTASLSQPNGSQLVYEDLKQIHEDDIKRMGLKWQLALLSMRTRRGPRNQDSRNMNQDNSRRTINVEETSSKSMVAIDGTGFDWSYMADDEVPTNMALIDFLDSEVHNDKTCSKTYLKSFETLKTLLDNLRTEFNKSEFNLATYKRGLASVEEQLVFYKKNEVIFCEQLAVLKRDISYKDSELSMLKSELEKLKQEKESNQLKIENFDNASKSLDKLIGSQITDKSRKGVGFVSYNVVPPPPTGLFSPPKFDLSNSGLEEFQQPEFEGYGPKTSKSVSEDISNEVRESPDAPLVEELVSDDKLEKKTVFPTVAKIEFVRPKQQEKLVRKSVKYDEMYRQKVVNTLGPNSAVVNAMRENPRLMCLRSLSKVGVWRLPNLIVIKLHEETNQSIMRQIQTSMNLIEDMLPLGEEPKEGKLLMCDKKNSVLFTNTGCFVLSPDFKLADESQIYLGFLFGILKIFITEIENLVDNKVKIIICDNGTEFKNRVMSEFCENKGIKIEFSIARTPQQNGVAERINRTLIEAARTMLADSKLPTIFWAEAVNTGCYVQNRGPVVQGEGSTHLVEYPAQTPVVDEAASTGVDVRYGEATTTDTIFEKVESLETDLKQTKLTYGAAYTKLIKKVKKLENKVKSSQARRRARIIVSDDEDDLEDPSKRERKIAEIDQDPAISLDVSTAEKDVSTANPVSSAGAAVTTASVVVSTTKDKGKAKRDESESETAQTKTKL
ncbi:ribonuclease H-like domain-containing protein [Tanacetum coccineum]